MSPAAWRNLALATLSFALSFAAWGLISAFAPGPCHEGYFSVDDGRVLQGPPPRPLPVIRVEERGGDIVATGIDIRGEGT